VRPPRYGPIERQWREERRLEGTEGRGELKAGADALAL
jgi:hypothetical protein